MWRRRASVRLGTEQDLARAGHALHCASPIAADQRCVTGLLDGPFRENSGSSTTLVDGVNYANRRVFYLESRPDRLPRSISEAAQTCLNIHDPNSRDVAPFAILTISATLPGIGFILCVFESSNCFKECPMLSLVPPGNPGYIELAFKRDPCLSHGKCTPGPRARSILVLEPSNLRVFPVVWNGPTRLLHVGNLIRGPASVSVQEQKRALCPSPVILSVILSVVPSVALRSQFPIWIRDALEFSVLHADRVVMSGTRKSTYGYNYVK
ncbi:hypothetical protein ASPVEDRAFT_29035 [Aspergillus versicolor CBS 583.65]|uniref:Uncharacterized protein n=1 Tax=Aspergillus versicolor CBS 583.65 TaxID=1036611 RepID=A0A1L9PLR9_ASPVE|nr:uncharacterized protein ASPVEDRAFT_29035 [Aspergillus versicolor CBS 583.65]OJJ02451.1 hypothetical protein ASPVEDRAFT_29035 [Aspergillus versicolor CBS 583.65]